MEDYSKYRTDAIDPTLLGVSINKKSSKGKGNGNVEADFLILGKRKSSQTQAFKRNHTKRGSIKSFFFDEFDVESSKFTSSWVNSCLGFKLSENLKNSKEMGKISVDKKHMTKAFVKRKVNNEKKLLLERLCSIKSDGCSKNKLEFGFTFELEPNVKTRDYMEDFINVAQEPDNESFRVYVLCDGHGGSIPAETISIKLPQIVTEKLHKLKEDEFTSENMFYLMNESFEEVEKLLWDLHNNEEDPDKFGESGSTTNLIILCREKDKRVVYSANVGDSRNVLIRREKGERLSYDHKATDKQEIKRVKDEGGLIIQHRFHRILAVTRSMADFNLKDEDVLGLSHTPHMTATEVNKDDRYVVLASDGVWDVISDEDIHHLLIQEGIEEKFPNLAQYVVRKALEKGSRDNISCIVVKLNDHNGCHHK